MSLEPVELGADNDERLARLRRVLELDDGFQLIIVEVAAAKLVSEVMARMSSWSGRGGCPVLRVVQLADGESPIARLRAIGPGGVVLLGLSSDSREQASLDPIVELNWNRDLLPRLVNGPLVLVVSTDELRALFERAPDLYSWRRHSAQLDIDPASDIELTGTDSWSFSLRIIQLSRMGVNLDLEASAWSPASLEEGRRLLRVAELQRSQGNLDRADLALARAKEIINIQGTGSDRVLLLLLRAESAIARGALQEASEELDGAAQIVNPDDDRGLLRMFAFRLAFARAEIAYMMGDVEQAESILLRLANSRHSRALIGAAFFSLGMIAARRREDIVARDRMMRARTIFKQLNLIRAENASLEALAGIASRHGRHHEARDLRVAAVTLAEQTGDVCLKIDSLAALARAALVLQDLEGASKALVLASEQVQQRFRREPGQPHTKLESWSQGRLALARAELAMAEQDFSEASACLREAESTFQELPRQAAHAALLRGECELRRQAWEVAREAYGTAEQLAEKSGAHELGALARLGRARACMGGGHVDEALIGLLEQAAGDFARLQQHVREACARTDLGRALIDLGKLTAAVEQLERAEALYRGAAMPMGEDEVAALRAQALARRAEPLRDPTGSGALGDVSESDTSE